MTEANYETCDGCRGFGDTAVGTICGVCNGDGVMPSAYYDKYRRTGPKLGAWQLKHFDGLTAMWKHDTLFSSNSHEICEHPAYRAIISMGEPVLPLIFKSFTVELDHWFLALAEITGVDAASGCTTMGQARDAWVSWGTARGYC